MNTAPANEPVRDTQLPLPYLARIHGMDAEGRLFKDYVVLENISSSGLDVRLPQRLKPGLMLFIVVRLSLQPEWHVSAQYLVARGKIAEIEPQADGTSRVAVAFTRCRFI